MAHAEEEDEESDGPEVPLGGLWSRRPEWVEELRGAVLAGSAAAPARPGQAAPVSFRVVLAFLRRAVHRVDAHSAHSTQIGVRVPVGHEPAEHREAERHVDREEV